LENEDEPFKYLFAQIRLHTVKD